MRKPASRQGRPFGDGITPGEPPAPRPTTCKAIERRLLELLGPLVEAAGGYVTSLEDVGEAGLTGLALTLGDRSFDIVVRECRK
jgi:hypothetical protein